jgi:hypothetical protein
MLEQGQDRGIANLMRRTTTPLKTVEDVQLQQPYLIILRAAPKSDMEPVEAVQHVACSITLAGVALDTLRKEPLLLVLGAH